MLATAAPLNVWVYSGDLARAKRFYSETLGLPLWREEPGEALHYGAGGSLLSIRPARNGGPSSLGVRVVFALGAEIDQACAELERRGVALEEPLADRPFGRSAMLRDPDGHELWLCRPSATETQFLRWQLSDRKKMRRIPVNRKPAPRPHQHRPRSRRTRHPPS